MSEEWEEEYEENLSEMKADTEFMVWLNDYFGGDGSWKSEYSGTWFSLHEAWKAGRASVESEIGDFDTPERVKVDLLILTSAKDRSAAAITSASDTTALEGPDAFPQLVIGTTEPITAKHLSAASTYETWSDSEDYTVEVALGRITAAGLEVYASATLGTVITDGKSGNLPLTSARLSAAALDYFTARPGASKFTLVLQVTVTDDAGNKRVFAQLPVTVAGTVPSYTQT